MQVNRDQFLEKGYAILREVVPRDELDDLRAASELLVDRQKVIWAREAGTDDPPGGEWETSGQPRLMVSSTPEIIDEKTAAYVEFWVHENTYGVSSALLGKPHAAGTEMMMMCSPVFDFGPASWHRDVHPFDTAPLQGYAEDILENGPRYVQWNIPLYDDSVLWVVPGSHVRFNTEEEQAQLNKDRQAPMPGGVQTHLEAGDGVVYITPILHWGSNYSTTLRRTLHGGSASSPRMRTWDSPTIYRPRPGHLPPVGRAQRAVARFDGDGVACCARRGRGRVPGAVGRAAAGDRRQGAVAPVGVSIEGGVLHQRAAKPRGGRGGAAAAGHCRPSSSDELELGPGVRDAVFG